MTCRTPVPPLLVWKSGKCPAAYVADEKPACLQSTGGFMSCSMYLPFEVSPSISFAIADSQRV